MGNANNSGPSDPIPGKEFAVLVTTLQPQNLLKKT